VDVVEESIVDEVFGRVIEVVAESSALMRSWVMSCGSSLWDWDISASVRVRSTRVSRPSVEERRRMFRVFWGGGVGEVVPLAVEGLEGFDEGELPAEAG
jgi:hypothetical protein